MFLWHRIKSMMSPSLTSWVSSLKNIARYPTLPALLRRFSRLPRLVVYRDKFRANLLSTRYRRGDSFYHTNTLAWEWHRGEGVSIRDERLDGPWEKRGPGDEGTQPSVALCQDRSVWESLLLSADGNSGWPEGVVG